MADVITREMLERAGCTIQWSSQMWRHEIAMDINGRLVAMLNTATNRAWKVWDQDDGYRPRFRVKAGREVISHD